MSKNVRYINFSDNISEHWDDLIQIAKSSYDSYWYIIHDKDEGKKPHLHMLCYDKGGTTIKAHCERFSEYITKSNLIEITKSSRAYLRYLIHLDNPEKAQYNVSEVNTNALNQFLKAVDSDNSKSQYDDYLRVLRKEMSPADFIKKYSYEFKNLNFYQKIMTFDKISKLI